MTYRTGDGRQNTRKPKSYKARRLFGRHTTELVQCSDHVEKALIHAYQTAHTITTLDCLGMVTLQRSSSYTTSRKKTEQDAELQRRGRQSEVCYEQGVHA